MSRSPLKSGAPILKKSMQTKVKKEKRDFLKDVKPIVLESTSTRGSTPSIYSNMSFRRGMTNAEYWKKATDLVQEKIQCKSLPKLPQVDYSVVLSPKLKARVESIMSYDFSESDDIVYIRDEQSKEKVKEISESSCDAEGNVKKKVIELRNREFVESFNESEFSDILRMQEDFRQIDMKFDVPLRFSIAPEDTSNNWMTTFLCNPDRVVWNSKAYEKSNDRVEKTLDEQAEELMDTSAEQFVEWLNKIGSGQSIITVEHVREMFSIKGDRTIFESCHSDPKEVNAIARTIAEKWNRPDIAIETLYNTEIENRSKQVLQKKMISAFGRTIPEKERPWIKSPTEVPIECAYPKELLSLETIFNGIRHLRITKALISFYEKHPKLKRPQYLVECGDFKEKVDTSDESDVPFYEQLGLKY